VVPAGPRDASERPVLDRLNARDGAEWLERARRGDFEGAWAVSDRILARTAGRRDGTTPRHQQQIWDGSELTGRRVLIRCYHGLGDTIQFVRYAPFVKRIASHVALWAQPALLPLLSSAPGIDRLLPLHDGRPEIEYDVDVEVMELPYVFRTTLSSIPSDIPYLQTARAVMPGRPPRIGIVWRAGEWDDRRSVPFARLTPLFDLDAVTWYALQIDRRSGEQHRNLRAAPTDGLGRMAACVRALDLVITIDSMPAHLAGALGVPVWTLLAAESDWRWMTDRSESPWYPTMRLFRQRDAGDWESVVTEVGTNLRKMVGR
jgi:hypothetical protein